MHVLCCQCQFVKHSSDVAVQISIVKRLREDLAPVRSYGGRGGYDRYDRGYGGGGGGGGGGGR